MLLQSWLNLAIQAPRASRGNALRSSGRSFSNSPPASHWRSIVQSLNGLLSILKENFVRDFYFVQKQAKSLYFLCVVRWLLLYCFRFLQFSVRRCLLRFFVIVMYSYLTGSCCSLVAGILITVRYQTMLCFNFGICYCSLLLRRECCTFNNGEYVKAGLAELELWCGQVKEEVLSLF